MSRTKSWGLDVRMLVVPASRRRAPADAATVAGFALLAIAFAIVERVWQGHLADDEARSALDVLLAICAVAAAVLLGLAVPTD